MNHIQHSFCSWQLQACVSVKLSQSSGQTSTETCCTLAEGFTKAKWARQKPKDLYAVSQYQGCFSRGCGRLAATTGCFARVKEHQSIPVMRLSDMSDQRRKNSKSPSVDGTIFG